MGVENLEEGVGREILPSCTASQCQGEPLREPSEKIGSSEKHCPPGICEMRDQKERVFGGKTASRELLVIDLIRDLG